MGQQNMWTSNTDQMVPGRLPATMILFERVSFVRRFIMANMAGIKLMYLGPPPWSFPEAEHHSSLSITAPTKLSQNQIFTEYQPSHNSNDVQPPTPYANPNPTPLRPPQHTQPSTPTKPPPTPLPRPIHLHRNPRARKPAHGYR